jgi:phosphoserine phosphatase
MKLLVVDVEGTLFDRSVRLAGTDLDSTIWQAIAEALGPDAVREEIETHRRWQAGEYRTYVDWMKATIEIHERYGLRDAVFRDLIDSAAYRPGVLDTFASLDRTAYETVLITGGFRELAARAQRDLSIRHAFAACEYLFDGHGQLASYNLLPCDFDGKLDFVHLMLREYQLGADDWVFIGDGANDAPIAAAAPYSIGLDPHPALAAVVTRVTDSFVAVGSMLRAPATS